MARGRPSRTTIYSRLDAAVAELRDRLGGLPSPKESESIWSDIWHLEAHHSTALEGNTLVLREVETLLEHGTVVGAKPLREYLEVKGYADAARWVYAQALEPGDGHDGRLLSIRELRHIHRLAMDPVWQVAPHPDATHDEAPGGFRRQDIHPFGSGMTPPAWPLVDAEVTAWVAAVNDTTTGPASVERTEPLPERLAEIHHAFECIHPFIDGNGRAGRLVLNLLLVRLGHPPAVILKRQRAAYLAALQKADAGDHGPLGELLARAMYDNLNRFIVPSLAGPARLVPLAALVTEEVSLVALRLAAQRGRLDAIQGSDGIWRSSRRAVDEYLRTRGTRRR
ncbi:MAG: Fic family protein [Dermatophilaceae bacterium]